MSRGAEGLSPVLRGLVKVVGAALGEVIAEAEGRELYELVEEVRRDMVALHRGRPRKADRALARARKRLAGLEPDRRAAFARAYTLYLELVNVCENAYRTHRLRQRRRRGSADGEPSGRAHAVLVLTAHPTESRSPTNIRLLRRGQDLLVESLDRGRSRGRGDDRRGRHDRLQRNAGRCPRGAVHIDR